MISRTIGPVWDGNEVWLIAAGGTLFFFIHTGECGVHPHLHFSTDPLF